MILLINHRTALSTNDISKWVSSTYEAAKSAVTKTGPALRGTVDKAATTATPTQGTTTDVSLEAVLAELQSELEAASKASISKASMHIHVSRVLRPEKVCWELIITLCMRLCIGRCRNHYLGDCG